MFLLLVIDAVGYLRSGEFDQLSEDALEDAWEDVDILAWRAWKRK
jgi:hypothetical protein